MLARRVPSILPDLTFEESLEVTKIHSVSGMLNSSVGIITKRPFRSPHNTISPISMIGGGKNPKPGEISLAHNGVLFLDELPEFNRSDIEIFDFSEVKGQKNVKRALEISAAGNHNCVLIGSPRYR